MKLTNTFLVLNALLLAAILFAALRINDRLQVFPTVGELEQLRMKNPVAWTARLKDRPQIETGIEMPQTVEIANATPLEVAITNRPEVDIMSSVPLTVKTYVEPLDVRIVTGTSYPSPQPAAPPQNARADYDRIFNASEARAKRDFPWMADPKSEGFRRARAIDAELERTNPTLFNDPNKPQKIAQMVAKEFAAKSRKP